MKMTLGQYVFLTMDYNAVRELYGLSLLQLLEVAVIFSLPGFAQKLQPRNGICEIQLILIRSATSNHAASDVTVMITYDEGILLDTETNTGDFVTATAMGYLPEN